MRKNPYIRRGLAARRLHRRLARATTLAATPRRPRRVPRRVARASRLRACRRASLALPRASATRATSPSSASGRWAAKARWSRSCCREFERAHPGIRVEVQQLPLDRRAREAADRVRRRRDARHLPARQHVDPGVRGARRARAARADRATPRRAIPRDDYFAGIWDTNVIDGTLLRRAVVRRHAPAVLPPRPARAAPASPSRRATWAEWTRALAAVKAHAGAGQLRDPAAAQRIRAAARARPAAGRAAAARRRHATATSRAPGFRRALGFYVDMFRQRLAPPSTNTADLERLERVRPRHFAFYITGPWNIGEFQRRLPAEPAGRLGDGAAAGARRARARRSRGGSSLVMFRALAAQGRGVAADRIPVAARRAAALPRADRRPAAAAQRAGTIRRSRDDPHARGVPRAARAREAARRKCPSGSASRTRCGSSPSGPSRGDLTRRRGARASSTRAPTASSRSAAGCSRAGGARDEGRTPRRRGGSSRRRCSSSACSSSCRCSPRWR